MIRGSLTGGPSLCLGNGVLFGAWLQINSCFLSILLFRQVPASKHNTITNVNTFYLFISKLKLTTTLRQLNLT